MRIKFKKLKQRELISNFKKENNFTWNELADFLKVKKGALIAWYYEDVLLPESVYFILDKKKRYSKYIMKKYRENWGKSKGGVNSRGSLKKIRIPEKSERLAEFIGAILGDGNIHSYKKGKKIGVYCVKIAGDYNKDKKYHINYIKPLCEELFGIEANIQNSPARGERFVSLYSKKIVEYLGTMGLKPGNKIKNQSTIPKWIFRSDSNLKACLRGLIDTDGSIFRMSKRDPNLLRINLKNHNKTLLEDARKAFIKVGFHPSKIICNNVFYLSRKEDIVRYINKIGFSNDKHKRRFQQFNSPVV